MLPWGGTGALHPPRGTAAPEILPEGSGTHHRPPRRTLDLPDPTTAKSCSESIGDLPASPGNVRSTQQKSARPMPSFPLL